MPLQATSGAASYDAFGGGVVAEPNYIESCFSTYLYTGNGSTQTINNGIDLAGKGGLVWYKSRSAAGQNYLGDTVRGSDYTVNSNTTGGNAYDSTRFTSFNTTGFSLGSTGSNNGTTYVSWTFRKQPKFFDVVTYTGTGSARTVAHNLGSVPGCIIIKRLDDTTNWAVYHRSIGATRYLILNSAAAAGGPFSGLWNDTNPSSTTFTLGSDGDVNASGSTYVAYLFAHDAGGFGLTGTDNVISCGSSATDSSGNWTTTLGYEPQWILWRNPNGVANWEIADTMRGASLTDTMRLFPNLANAEVSASEAYVYPTATGFVGVNGPGPANGTIIYIAIRRGPMKVPTDGTSVFGLNARTGTGANATVTGGQIADTILTKNRGSSVAALLSSRLISNGYLVPSTPAAQVSAGTTILQVNPWDVMDGVKVGTTSTIINSSGGTFINYLFKRAPSFMDVVCYTGDSQYGRNIDHNLTVPPELIIVKSRTSGSSAGFTSFIVGSKTVDGSQAPMRLDSNAATTGLTVGGFPIIISGSFWNTSFSITDSNNDGTGSLDSVNLSPQGYIAYLFATCPGVSKVGTYTGNGTTQTINCGFAGGARFVLIKRTDATGDWYTYDTARGMTVLTDPYFLMNTTAAEVATLGSVTTVTTGFALNAAILTAINVNAGTYIFLAIA